MNPDVLASYTQNIAQGQKYDSRINAVYSGCLVLRVGGSRLGVGLIKFCDIQRSLLARSISDPSVLATRGAYVVILSLCCVLSVCNVFTTPRAGPQSQPLPIVLQYHLSYPIDPPKLDSKQYYASHSRYRRYGKIVHSGRFYMHRLRPIHGH